jgi:multidrug efflux pump subunit AcrB
MRTCRATARSSATGDVPAAAHLPPGAVQAGDARLNVQAGGAYKSVAELSDEPVRAQGGRIVRVKDIATVGWAYEEQPHFARFNGKRAVWVTMTQKDGLNVLDIRNNAVKAADAYRMQLPPDVQMVVGFDQSDDIARKLDQLGRDFAIALGLVLITLLPLGWRASIVVMVSVPLSLAMGVAVLNWSGFTLNQLAISGFIIALGLLVDDSIVVTENIARHLRMGKSRGAAAVDGTTQIAVAVIGCTFVLLFAFLPLTMLPEGETPAAAFVHRMVAMSDGQQLARAFISISDSKLRRQITDLVESMARLHRASGASTDPDEAEDSSD